MRFEKLAPFLDERMRRLVAASESLAIGFGGTSQVSRQTGVSRRAIIRGIKELDEAPSVQGGRVRRPGGGRKRTVDKDASLKTDLERLVDPVTRGDPEVSVALDTPKTGPFCVPFGVKISCPIWVCNAAFAIVTSPRRVWRRCSH